MPLVAGIHKPRNPAPLCVVCSDTLRFQIALADPIRYMPAVPVDLYPFNDLVLARSVDESLERRLDIAAIHKLDERQLRDQVLMQNHQNIPANERLTEDGSLELAECLSPPVVAKL